MGDEMLPAGVAAGEVCSRCESWSEPVHEYETHQEGVRLQLCDECAFEAFTEGTIDVGLAEAHDSRTRASRKR